MSIKMVRLPLYGFIVVLAVLIGALFIYINLKDEIKKNKQILLFYIMYIAFSFIFGKIYTSLIYNETSFITAGLSAYGGLFGVIVAALIFEKIIPLDGKIIKYSVLSLPLVYSITKIACFIGGCCSGIEYTGFFNVIYPFEMNIKQFPIQLVETIVFFVIFLVGCKLEKNKNKNVNHITLILVAIFKFLLDYFRYEHIDTIISRNQIFSIVLLFTLIGLMLLKKLKKQEN